MNYQIENTSLSGLYKIHLKIFNDARGSFIETFRENLFKEMGIKEHFVQDMTSISKKNVLRGLHYQIQNPAGKLIYAARGRMLDVAVDLRIGSKTFGKYESFELEENDGLQLYLPPGMAHGFVALDEINELRYRSTEYYNPEDEAGLFWNDVNVGIDWGVNKSDLIINDRDMNFPVLKAITRDKLPKLF